MNSPKAPYEPRAKLMARVGGGVSLCVPELRRRHPADRVAASAAGRWFFAAVAAISTPESSVADAWVHSGALLPAARVAHV